MPFADVVQGRRGLVENQHWRILEQDAGDRQALPLTAGEVLAALADLGVVAARHRHDLVVQVRQLGGVLNLLAARRTVAVGDVLGDGAREHQRRLAHVADEPTDVLARHVFQRHAAEQNAAFQRMRQAEQDLDPGRFAAAGQTGHADRLAVANGQIDAVEGAAMLSVRPSCTPPSPSRRR